MHRHLVPLLLLFLLAGVPAFLSGQTADQHVVGPKLPPVETRDFDGLAEGPYDRLVIRNVMVIPGNGGPPTGPHDILIEGNVISEVRPFDPIALERARLEGQELERLTGDRVIEGDGMYVMPGMIDLHYHPRDEPLPLEYTHYLKLAHGVTSGIPGAGIRTDEVQRHHDLAERYEFLAPRMFPIWVWGRGTGASRAEIEDPAQAEEIAREMRAQGAHVVDVGRGGYYWSPELLEAVCAAVAAEGGITTFHIPPSITNYINAVDAARAGVTMIEHLYGYPEAAMNRSTHNFPRDYHYDNENHRFREAARAWWEVGENPETRERLLGQVADSLVHYGVTMLPTRVTYEVNRDFLRGTSLPWHEKYTHQALIDWNVPDPASHAAHHWDWTSDDEYYWNYAFNLWSELIFEFNKRGGHLGYGADDNFQWATAGFSNIRELQLVRESGLHNLEVLQSATHNSAQTLGQPLLGLVRPGYLADLVLVDGNPAENFRYMYSFGAIRMADDGSMERTRGIVHTIKDGVVIENALLMEEVARMVAESKRGVPPNLLEEPFLTSQPGNDGGDR
ncbi:MAG: amidohydrolase family protein [Gemmatimonadota bacterium]